MEKKAKSGSRQSRPVVLVGGGGRFLGLTLCEVLLSQNLDVYWLESSIPKEDQSLKSFQDRPNFNHLHGEITNYLFPKKFNPAYIFHLAGVEEYLSGRELQLDTLLANSQGTKNLLELARLNQSRFLLVSSIDIYSGFLSQFNLETYYGTDHDASKFSHHEAKRYAEALTFEYHKLYGVDARIVRVADVYGPRMNLDSAAPVARLFHQAANFEPLAIEGDGLMPVRPTYVSDLIYGLIKAMFNQVTNGKIYSLVSPEEVTILNLAYQIRNACRNEVQVLFLNEEAKTKRFAVDRETLSRTQRDLGWRPKVSLKEGVVKTMAWIREGGEAVVVDKSAMTIDLPPPAEPEEKIKTKEKSVVTPKTKSEVKQAAVGQKEQVVAEGRRKKPAPLLPSSKPIEAEQEEAKTQPALTGFNIKSSAPIGIRSSTKRRFPTISFRLPGFRFGLPSLKIPRFRLTRPRPGRPSRRLAVFIMSLLVVIGIGLGPPLVFSASGALAVYRLQNAIDALRNQEVEKAEKEAALAHQDLVRAEEWLTKTTWLAGMVNRRQELENWRELTLSLQEIALGTAYIAKAAPQAFVMTRTVLGQTEASVDDSLRLIKVDVNFADDHLALAEARLKKISSSWYPKMISGQVDKLQENVPKVRRELAGIRKLLQVFPKIIGSTSQRTYLLLLQNNMELRPGGGFIGSLGIIKFVNGRMVDLKIEDVYNADGQLKTPVVAPEPIKTYLKQPNWSLRDSNWSPHFPTNAAQAQWFLKNSLGTEVDGVIALDLSFVKEIIAVTGPVEILDYQETISAGELFKKAEYQVEKDFFPGSTKKRDFLGALARAMIQKVVNADEGVWPALIAAAGKSAREKHLLVSLSDPSLNQILTDRGWNGAIPIDRKIVSGNHFRDFLMVVDANLGVNKANYFVRRSIFHQVVVDREGNLAERVTIEYDNQSPAETWPGGPYTNYLRVYVTSGAILQDVRIDNRIVPDQVFKGRELGKTVWALPIQVPIKSKLTVSFEYHLTQPLPFEGGLSVYELKVLKQPGTIDDRFRLTFNYPSYYQILRSEPTGKAEQQGIVFTTTLEEDRDYKIELVK